MVDKTRRKKKRKEKKASSWSALEAKFLVPEFEVAQET